MNKILLTVILLCLLCAQRSVTAQQKCGTMNRLNEYLSQQNEMDISDVQQQIKQSVLNNKAAKNSAVITIPVVVHVVYRTVFENLADDVIYDAIAVLNEDFRALNDLSNLNEAFKDAVGDAEIEFCLANVNPQGHPTTGINRVQTTVSNFGESYNENKIKFTDEGGADAWPAKRYLNIWVGNISNDGLLGYAQFPNFGAITTDGIVIDDRSFGRAGVTNNVFDDGTTTHEVGHWLGLFHIWGDDCAEVNGAEVCRCNGSDEIADTNNAQGPAGGCNTQTSSCGSLDMIQNFMDYSSCSAFFTNGQVEVMRAVLAPDGFRSGLATSTNCAELKPNDLAIIELAFPAKNEVVCTQKFSPAIQFANNGSDTLKQAIFKIWINDSAEYTAEWNGALLFADYATIELTEITGNIGSQKITVEVESINGVADANANNDLVEQNFQIKIPSAQRLPFKENFEMELDQWSIINTDEDTTFTIISSLSHFGAQCLALNNFEVEESGRVDELISQNLNIASFTEPQLKFYYASANKRTKPGLDELQVLLTKDCGVHFDTLFYAIGDDLASTSKTDSNFKPVNSQWKRVVIDLDAYKQTDLANIHFKFISGLGNNFYLDDITITGEEPVATNVFNQPGNFNMILSPNPFQQQIFCSIPKEHLSKKINILMYDALGRQIKNTSIHQPEGQATIQVDYLPAGIYYVQLQVDQSIQLIQKMIKL